MSDLNACNESSSNSKYCCAVLLNLFVSSKKKLNTTLLDDLDSLNSTISLYQLIPLKDKNPDRIHLHFFFNYDRFENYKIDESFVQKFLLCNQLSNYIKKEKTNLIISVYLDNANLDKLDYVENLKKSSNYTFYEY